MKKLLLVGILVTGLFASKQCYKVVDHEARKYKINGKIYPSRIKGIYKTESDCTQTAIGDLNRKITSIGAGQMQIPTARTIGKWYQTEIGDELDKMSDYAITVKLIKDIRFSVKLTAHYIKHYVEAGWTIDDATIIYNGWWEVDKNGKAKRDEDGNKIKNYAYLNRVKRNTIKVFNIK